MTEATKGTRKRGAAIRPGGTGPARADPADGPGSKPASPARAAPRAPSRKRPSRINVSQELRERIARQDFPPGTKLKEQDLAAEFGVSRARIREAFGALEQRGLIERIPNRGAVVTRLEPHQIFDLYDVREVLEGLAVRLATENAPPGTWDDLLTLFGKDAERFIEAGELDAYAGFLDMFRQRIAVACNNEILAQQLDSLLERTGFLVRRLIMVPGRAKEGLYEHRAILEAMRSGDADQAERLKRANIRAARECFRRYRTFLL